MRSVVLLGSRDLDGGGVAIGAPATGVACGLRAGSAARSSTGTALSEDSVATLVLAPGCVAGIVADSHFGTRAGEALVLAAVAALEAEAPAEARALARLLLDNDVAVGAVAPHGDHSEATLLIALVRGRELRWAGIGDSRIVLLSERGARRLDRGTEHFAGAPPAPALPGELRAEFGGLTLVEGECVVLASDGLAAQDGEPLRADAVRALAQPGAPEARVRAALAAGAAAGRDDAAVVLVDPARMGAWVP